jgi:hypothetical protein
MSGLVLDLYFSDWTFQAWPEADAKEASGLSMPLLVDHLA